MAKPKPTARANGAHIQVWEDDPEPAVLVRRLAPKISRGPLAFAFKRGPAPKPGIYSPGSFEFRYWVAADALRRTADFWAKITGLKQWGVGPTLNVILDEGKELNAYYDRKALNFFQGPGVGGTIFTGESPDVLCHEMGHAVLDTIKPQLYEAATAEAPAFHESFADLSAILSALQLPSLRETILRDTGGKLHVNSRLSRLAEQVGSATRAQHPTQAEPDCLRNAANAFAYQDPVHLPRRAPASQLSSEPHNFSRVFTGAGFEILAGIFDHRAAASSPSGATLLAAAEDFAKILVEGARRAPVVANLFPQVAAAMIDASASYSKAYPAILRAVFVRRSILSLDSAVSAATLAGVVPGRPEALAPLADLALPAGNYGLDRPLVVSAASHARRYEARAAAVRGAGPMEPASSSSAARAFVDDLFSQGRVEYGEFTPQRPHFNHGRQICTHTLVRHGSAALLSRRIFDCGMAH